MTFIQHQKNGLVWLTAPHMETPHAFTTRLGGVSRGIFASLNLAASRGDEEDKVRENYRLLEEATGIPTHHMAFTRQVHGADVRVVSHADAHRLFTDMPYEADGLVTAERGLALICFIADCVPVLLSDESHGVIAAVHCGWRSSVADILGNAVGKMCALGARPECISAAIGPAISRCCFEVGGEVVAAVQALLGEHCADLWAAEEGKPGKFLLDLKGVNARRLEQLGLRREKIVISPDCTMCQSDVYWSHRKSAGQRGSQAALIVWDGKERAKA